MKFVENYLRKVVRAGAKMFGKLELELSRTKIDRLPIAQH
jgi:hypothetical protein